MIEVRTAGEGELERALELRRAVFVAEQGISCAEEADGRDGEAVHLLALAGQRVVGTCRLLVDPTAVRLGRLAVARRWRRQGVATTLLAAAELEARRRGAGTIALNAQTHALGLYRAAGYQPRGQPFLEAGVAHLRMERRLA